MATSATCFQDLLTGSAGGRSDSTALCAGQMGPGSTGIDSSLHHWGSHKYKQSE